MKKNSGGESLVWEESKYETDTTKEGTGQESTRLVISLIALFLVRKTSRETLKYKILL